MHDVLETATGRNTRDNTGVAETRLRELGCKAELCDAGRGGSETGFLQEMALNKHALSTNRNKPRKGNTVVWAGTGRLMGKQ